MIFLLLLCSSKRSLRTVPLRAIHMDPKRHPNPRCFDPSRYFHDHRSARESALCSDVKERDHFLFGAGRRICKGIDIGENSLFLGLSRMLWAFNFEKSTDTAGKEITPDPNDLVGGLAASPRPFPAKIVPRTEKHAQAIRTEWELTQSALNSNDKQWKDVPQDLAFGQYEKRLRADK